MFTTKTRYEQISAPVEFYNLKKLAMLLEERVDSGSDLFGENAKQIEFIRPHIAEKAVAAIDEIVGVGEDPSHFVLMVSQDRLAGPDFVWDMRQGSLPGTSSRSTVPHHPVSLAPGRSYFDMFVKKGDVCDIVSDGWAPHYFNHLKCMEVVGLVSRFVGDEWHTKISRIENDRGIPQSIHVTLRHEKADKVEFSLYLVGQGRIREIPNLIRDAVAGAQFFNVLDNDSDRVRMGSNVRGHVWQY